MLFVKVTNIRTQQYKLIDTTGYSMLDLERTYDTYESTNRFYIELVKVEL